ncbi:MAG: transcription-repair coupling factor [Nitrospirota bacterium]
MYFNRLQNLLNGLRNSRIYNLKGSSSALFLSLYEDPFLAVESTEELAKELYRDINFFRDALKKEPVFLLPGPDGPRSSGERARVIHSLTEKSSFVTSFKNNTAALWDVKKMDVIHVKKAMESSRGDIEKRLSENGYKNVPLVTETGEFSRRGWIIDIFPTTSEKPIRLEFFGDEVENIRMFDIETQRSYADISEFSIYPAVDPVYGISLFELMRGKRFFFSESIPERENLPTDGIFLSPYSFEGAGHDAGLLSIRGLGILPEERKHLEHLPQRIRCLAEENRVALISSSEGQAERLKNILRDGGVIAPIVDRTEIFEYQGRVSISIGELSSGFFIDGLLLLTEKEIFGGRPGFRPIKKSRVSKLLTSLDDLRPGDFVVHRDHGIGRFRVLLRQSIEGTEEDLMLIDYEDGRLYLPLQGINAIHKYHSEEGIVPKVDRLGGRTWQRTRKKIERKIQQLAQKLLRLYAEREVHKGFSFSQDTELHYEFDSFFSYEETPDQFKAIADIKKDMESEKPMERLLCGDVGYGKTEVAMRAAFKAVYDGMQVALLVPTTILCEQHYRTFKTRFSAFPVNIDFMSRFKSRREQKETLRALAYGDVDILIGTHSLLAKDVHFHKLGLLIIDEEHRFGVRQKEKLKELKKGVDVLTLTATPIPRTLYMALSDIRDMSVIETPPEERLAVKSAVSLFDKELICNAIREEIARNGQVFFVHNRVKDIYKIAAFIAALLPSARTAVAHGQMPEKELEKVMHEFYDQKIDVLVSTAIIGSGLDIPTANTIIINRADLMGLADLYQLRGRVGRGNVRAYAYFIVPGEDIITEEAKKRLQAIQEMSYLGAGFRLALKDLEIRGAGNILGPEQSGHIHAVGFDLYMEMLEKAVAELRGVKIEEEFEPSVSLKVKAFIPEYYIDDITLRLSTYRKIAASKTEDALDDIRSEMEDRFGKIPAEAENLIEVMRLKIMARKLFIANIKEVDGRVRMIFSPETKVEPRNIFALRDKVGTGMKYLPEGFELDFTGFSRDKVNKELFEVMHTLSKSSSLLV